MPFPRADKVLDTVANERSSTRAGWLNSDHFAVFLPNTLRPPPERAIGQARPLEKEYRLESHRAYVQLFWQVKPIQSSVSRIFVGISFCSARST